mmetsp:Transcript_30857/g.28056  ORF Transcript_30857/g.28056 Transcript_30857/m.28056 type:complete len:110 (+) Transcript_30857:147-476(+)
MVKLAHRIAFPSDIKLTANKAGGNQKFYELNAIVIHLGQGLHYGHYVCIIKHKEKWLMFDDDTIEMIDERFLTNYFGTPNHTHVAYLLFYQAINEDDPLSLSTKTKSEN